MASLGQIRGYLLEEVVLFLLQASGYRTVPFDPADETLQVGSAGLEVVGRGASHQVDALAEFAFWPPFSHRQRLVVEAKCLKSSVGIGVARNAVGVIKDIGEYWATRAGRLPTHRYHYQYSIFSASSFSDRTERYAFAHDIHLFPLRRSRFCKPILDAIWQLRGANFGKPRGKNFDIDIAELRSAVRSALGREEAAQPEAIEQWGLQGVVDAAHDVGGALLGVLAGSFPIFFTPRSAERLDDLPGRAEVQIRNRRGHWYVEWQGARIMSFDLPPRLFVLYFGSSEVEPLAALEMKEEQFAEIQLMRLHGAVPRLHRLVLDQGRLLDLANRLARELREGLE